MFRVSKPDSWVCPTLHTSHHQMVILSQRLDPRMLSTIAEFEFSQSWKPREAGLVSESFTEDVVPFKANRDYHKLRIDSDLHPLLYWNLSGVCGKGEAR